MAQTHRIIQTSSSVDGKEKIELDFSEVSIKQNDTFYLYASNGEVFLIIPSDISNNKLVEWLALVYNVQPDINAEASQEGEVLTLIGNDLNLQIDFGSVE